MVAKTIYRAGEFILQNERNELKISFHEDFMLIRVEALNRVWKMINRIGIIWNYRELDTNWIIAR